MLLYLLKRNNVSAAMFAPGWVYETAQQPNFNSAQNKWWSLVEKSCGIVQTIHKSSLFTRISIRALVTMFHSKVSNSQIVAFSFILHRCPMVQHFCQSLQPLLELNEDNKDVIQATLDTREASFNGGDYITFRGKLEGDAYFTTRLFKSHLHLSSSPITISFSVTSDETSKHGILLSFSSPSHETKSILVSRQESICRFNNMFLQCLATSAQTVSEWTVQETSLVLDDHVQYQQKPETLLPASPLVIEAHNMELVPGYSGSKSLRVKLEWRQKDLEDSAFPRYNVYAENVKSTDLRPRKVLEKPRSETVFLGVAHVPSYYIAELVVESDVKGVRFVFKPVLKMLRFTYHGGAGRNRNCHFLLSMILLVGIDVEYNVSYVYHALDAYIERDNVGLKGFTKFFNDSSLEERGYAEKFMEYQMHCLRWSLH
ncbi:Ferritin/ribonucleotide reductase-like family protein [Arabidopsis thaliana]|uniref:Ferritin/ribonucleotide reductase-like family protein n=1 Tax=Arabidopsis thaliana TaxID=3702 RepID=F4JD24_ARATH|nr:Ferritin/ribonucleotide reductase-like family protein [Arabidopsis thaliana]NP_191660.3 Ferritin/ribonucleotide reductase-like family protein [Arabidopsis thaliana]AEE80136.1 Ferritin/ribonucleotide reductase-like family protein [Arabidopsis thaliana]ANM63438.1 Ferritin/ribonucleotide reductase-like family protein [Arabidopsis thaliana]|eukprot:NP_001319810.1 Ferritin/ribonucleotide reductase-like family protein [Arabidopsis thaliana]